MDVKLVGFLPILPLLKYVNGYDLTWEQLIKHASKHKRGAKVYDNYCKSLQKVRKPNSKREYLRIHK